MWKMFINVHNLLLTVSSIYFTFISSSSLVEFKSNKECFRSWSGIHKRRIRSSTDVNLVNKVQEAFHSSIVKLVILPPHQPARYGEVFP